MKLAIAALSTAVFVATSASAMVTEAEKAHDAQLTNGGVQGAQTVSIDVTTRAAGPSVDWSVDGMKTVTIFTNASGMVVKGQDAR